MLTCLAACLAGCGVVFVSAAADSPATKPAPASQRAAATQRSPIRDQAVALYMKGEWAPLEKLLKEQAPAAGTMPATDPDVEAIKSALAECRPAWWNIAKAGKKATLRASLFGRSVNLAFDPSTEGFRSNSKSGASAGWSITGMDDPAPWMEGLSKSELTLWYACQYFGMAMASQEEASLRAGTAKFSRAYMTWRKEMTTATYGTPAVRRHAIHQAFRTFEQPLQEETGFTGHRALGVLFMIECLSQPETYPTYQFPGPVTGEIKEETLAARFLPLIDAKLPTLAEDCSLRAVYKKAGSTGSGALTSGLFVLPNGLSMSADLKIDKPLYDKRTAWFKAQLEKLSKSAK
jgi:hypothetical protein